MPLSGSRPPAPELTGSALDAVRHRGSHVQIIAAAGSGKTEVVSQRVADLLAAGVPADSIVAFTFTERAAEELKNRIAHRVEDRLGTAALDQLAGLFVGTIHAFCFRMLQQRVPRYETQQAFDYDITGERRERNTLINGVAGNQAVPGEDGQDRSGHRHRDGNRPRGRCGGVLTLARWSSCGPAPGPDVQVGGDGHDEQAIDGVQGAEDHVIVGQAREQALHEGGQRHQ
jgi:hypothetical protein